MLRVDMLMMMMIQKFCYLLVLLFLNLLVFEICHGAKANRDSLNTNAKKDRNRKKGRKFFPRV